MIYGFARQSRGYAEIDSQTDVGSTIALYLPHTTGDEFVEQESLIITDAHAARAGEVILVVEDEPVVRALVIDVLQELGYQTLEAADGIAGLSMLQSNQRIDLLVSDVGLPGLNGRQMAEAGREKRPDLNVLFMTGYAETATVARDFLGPGMAMIAKPFALEVLATRVREMLEAR